MIGTFSYIIPFYNSKNTIVESISSILDQDDALEIILVDDHSEDNPKDVIGCYLEKYEKIKYIRNDFQLGPGLSRNVGARAAAGDILVFLDADIVIPPETSRIIRNYFFEGKIRPQPDAVVANRAKEELCKSFVSRYKNYWTSYTLSTLKGWTSFLGASFVAIKKDIFWAVNGFRSMPCAEDNDLGYRLAMNDYKIYFADDLMVSHNKKFSVFSLLKREFRAGREGIKVAIANKALRDLIREKKFFAVNENFIYSFPFSFIFSFGVILGVMFLNPFYLFVSTVSALAMVFLNREFLVYSSCNKNYIRGVAYIFLMIPQMNAIGFGMFLGLCELLIKESSNVAAFVAAHTKSFLKLFVKNLLLPEQLTFFVTNRCNLDCSHCFVDKNSITEDQELTVGEIDKIAQTMPKIKYVTITGGEPFLRKDIVDIVRTLNTNLRPLMITILTNGYMLDIVTNRVDEILEDCPQTNILLKISIDGPAETHDEIRQKLGSFDNACAAFAKLKKLKHKHQNFNLGLITTYTEKNANHIKDLYDDVIIGLNPDQYGLILERPNRANELNEMINIDDYITVLKQTNRMLFSSAKGLFQKFRLAYKTKMAEKLKEIYLTKKYPMKCFAGVLNAVISANGDIFACEQIHEKFGNLREADYDWNKVWRSPQAQSIRDSISQKKCFCTNECFMPFNISYNLKNLLGVLKTLICMNKNARRDTSV